jgi:hypothetical protein
MSDKEITGGQLWTLGSYDVEFKDGKLIGQVSLGKEYADGVSASGSFSISIDAHRVIDALARAIPGQIDDAVFELVKKALGV